VCSARCGKRRVCLCRSTSLLLDEPSPPGSIYQPWKTYRCVILAGEIEAHLIRSRDIVRVVVEQLQRDETVFLHPLGVDEQCDEARLSLRARE
jgi:hypothetical protein